jgi:hypothetical protein
MIVIIVMQHFDATFSFSHNIFVPVVAFADHPYPSSGADEILGHANFDLQVIFPLTPVHLLLFMSRCMLQGAITSLKTSIPWMTFDTSSATHALADNPVVAKAVGASLRPVRPSSCARVQHAFPAKIFFCVGCGGYACVDSLISFAL